MREGFDNDKYIELQAERIRERVEQFGGKLYLEFGGKLFDDYHASRVLPGFKPDTKISMLQSMKDDVEIVIAINANDIERSKVRGDLGITYDEDVLRLMDIFRSMGFKVGSVVITRYANQPDADLFRKRLTAMGIVSYLHYPIPGYPNDIDYIVSDEGFGKNGIHRNRAPYRRGDCRAPARARWPPASPSSIMSTSVASPPATPSTRPHLESAAVPSGEHRL